MSPPPDLAYQYSPEELTSKHQPKHSHQTQRSHHSHHSQHSEHSSHSDHAHGYAQAEEPRGKYERIPENETKNTVIAIKREPDHLPDLHIDDMIRAAHGKDPTANEGMSFLLVDVKHAQGSVHDEKQKRKHAKQSLNYRHPVLHRVLTVLLVFAIVIGSIGAAASLWVVYQLNRGRRQMIVNYDGAVITLPTDNKQITSEDYGQTVRYNGHVYALNPNISTVLFMGIDREEMDGVSENGKGGQADVILLIAEDTETGKMKILNISRDTYAEYMLYSKSGYQLGYEKQQICLAYAYGDGREKSCENTVRSVQNLLYGMPISKYIAMDMDGVIAANEAIGGVTLNAIEDITLANGKMVSAGQEITLHDEDVNCYIRAREHDIDGNTRRMEREKQFVSRFASLAVQQAKADLGVITTLYNQVMPYIVTDLEIGDLVFLAQIYMNCGVDFEFKNLTGEMGWLDNQYGKEVAVLYPDEDNLFETVLDLYYTQVDENNSN